MLFGRTIAATQAPKLPLQSVCPPANRAHALRVAGAELTYKLRVFSAPIGFTEYLRTNIE